MKALRAWFELVRLPNVFTAVADVLAGYWLISQTFEWNWKLACLVAASASLYSFGIVLNDLRDIDVDARERPDRPLPSGRIKQRDARRLAVVLAIAGLGFAALAGSIGPIGVAEDSVIPDRARCLLAAALLLGAIIAYDVLLKATWLGPACMGACRGLNLLLGMSFAWWFPPGVGEPGLLAIIAMTIYVASFTYFGRDEAGRSRRFRLATGTFGALCGIIMLVMFVASNRSGTEVTLILWLALLIHITRMAVRAIRAPEPARVQRAMKTFIFGIVVFDATIATSEVGWPAGLCILLLLLPASLLGRWVYST